jgi:hypothetical protein
MIYQGHSPTWNITSATSSISFLDDHNAENEFAWPFVTFIHLLIDFTKVAFYDDQKTDYYFSGPFAYLKNHLSDTIQVVISMLRMKEMSSYGLSTPSNVASRTWPKFFLRRPESCLRVHRVIRLLKTSIKRHCPSGFFESQDAENEFVWNFYILKHRFIDITKVFFFETSRRQIMF